MATDGALTLRPGTMVRWHDGRLLVAGWQRSSIVDCSPAYGTLWLRLEPLLRAGLDPATAGLAAGTAAAVRRILDLLAAHDVLVEAATPRDGHPLAAFLAGTAAEPAAALAAVRRATVALDGGPAVGAALAAGGLATADPSRTGPAVLPVTVGPDAVRVGPGRIAIAASGYDLRAHPWLPHLVAHEVVRELGGLTDGTTLSLAAATARRGGPAGHLPHAGAARPDRRGDPVRVVGDGGPLAEAVVAARASCGRPVVVGAAPDWPAERHRAAQRAAHAGGAGYLPVRARATSVEIGPLSRPGDGACLDCADTRRRTVLGSRDAAVLVADGRPLPLPPYWLALIAHLVVERLAGDDPPASVTVLAVRDGTVDRHRVQPAPDCPVCDRLPPDSAAAARIVLLPRPQPAPDRLRVSDRPPHADLVDARYGPVVRIHPERRGPVALAAAELPVPGQATPLAGFGRAADDPGARALALLEAVERDAGRCPQARRTAVRGSYRDLAADAVDPARLGLPDPAAAGHPDYRLVPYSPETVTSWVWAHDLAGDRRVLVPEHVAYYGGAGPRFLFETSSGCAVGGCLEEAVLHGCLEAVERDAFLLTWYAGRTPPALTLPDRLDPTALALAGRIAAEGYRLHLFDVTADTGIPVVWALAVTGRPDRSASFSAAGAHPDPSRAAAAAILEAGVTLLRTPGPPDAATAAMLDNPDLVSDPADHTALHRLPGALPRFDFAVGAAGPPRPFDAHFAGWRERWAHPDLTEVVRRVVTAMAAAGIAPLAVDQTRTVDRRLGLAAVKVLAPGAVPMTFGHLNRRVDLPRLRSARAAHGDRPILPHPFP